MGDVVEMINFLLMLVAVDILVKLWELYELKVFTIISGVVGFLQSFRCSVSQHHTGSYFVSFSLGRKALQGLQFPLFVSRKKICFWKVHCFLMKKSIATYWLRNEVVWVQRKILPFLSRGVNLLMLTQALSMQAVDLLQFSSCKQSFWSRLN